MRGGGGEERKMFGLCTRGPRYQSPGQSPGAVKGTSAKESSNNQ